MSDRVYIFDTTLRDGEQSPGCSMTVPEKTAHGAQAGGTGRGHPGGRLPHRLGRRFRSRGRRQPRVSLGAVAALARALHAGCGARRRSRWSTPRRPRIHTFIATSDIHLKYKLQEIAAAGAGRSRGRGGAGAAACGRRGVFGRGRRPHRSRLSGEDLEGRGGGRARAR